MSLSLHLSFVSRSSCRRCASGGFPPTSIFSCISPLMSPTGKRPCATAGGWSWLGYTGTFSLGALLLLSLAQSASANAACPPAVVPRNLSQSQYQNTTGGEVVGFVTAFVQSFLNTVQPNEFPIGQCQRYFLDVPTRPCGPVFES